MISVLLEMLRTDNLLRRLFYLSLYTSLLMAVVSITPFLSLQRDFPPGFYLFFTAAIYLTVFVIWQINIGLVWGYERARVKRSRQWTRYLLSFLLSLLVGGLLVYLFHHLPMAERFRLEKEVAFQKEPNPYAPLFSVFFLNLFVVFIQELVLLREKKTKIELENARLRVENAEAINQQLKQHIHPHFLFNSLSVLKSLITNNPDLAEEYLIKLSDFLRVSISAREANVVKLSDEYKLCLDFIEMQKIRFGEALHFCFDIPEVRLEQGYVPGFSLQVLLENAIKHNVLTEDMPLHILVDCEGEWLRVTNNIQKKLSAEHTTKLGLANLTERYRMVSGEKVEVEEAEGQFCVRIKILTDEDINY